MVLGIPAQREILPDLVLRLIASDLLGALYRRRRPADIFCFGLGSISRIAHSVGFRPRESIFMTAGWGFPISVGLGLALGLPESRVVVVDGDGAALHSLSVLVNVSVLAPPNLVVVVVENRVYASTGGQPIPFLHLGVDLVNLFRSMQLKNVERIVSPSAILERVDKRQGPFIGVATCSAESGRHPRVPLETVMESLGKMREDR